MATRPVEGDGGAGNRTLVRTSVQRGVYVRRPWSSRGPGPVHGPPSRNEPLRISPAARGGSRQASPALLFDAVAPGGLRHRRLLQRARLSLGSQRQIRIGSWKFPSGLARDLDLGPLPHLLLTRRNQKVWQRAKVQV